MSPVTHLLLTWTMADATCASRRDRCLVTVAGLLPDVDGFGAVIDCWPWNPAIEAVWFSTWHHTFGHGLLAGLTVAALVAVWARDRWRATGMALLVFHVHLLCDLVGARGPDGHQWPVRYGWPLNNSGWTWDGQWLLNAWPNWLLTIALLSWALYRSWRQGRSPLELLSRRADRGLSDALRRRFGQPADDSGRIGI